MEDSLADQLIRVSQARQTDVDDIGIPNPPSPSQVPQFWNYLAARAFFFNRHLYRRPNTPGILWNEHTAIDPKATPSDIQALTHYYQKVPERGRRYVYQYILDHAPLLDTTKICVAPGLLWDLENQTFIQTENINTITDW